MSYTPASSISGTGQVSASTNGLTISVGVPNPTALSRWEYPVENFNALAAIGQGSLSLVRVFVPFAVTGTAVQMAFSISGSTNTSATTASVNLSLRMAIYTMNGSTLSLASSGSANNGFQWSQSASSTANTSVNSMRRLTVPMNVNLSAGVYWVAAAISSATTYTNVGLTVWGNSLVSNNAQGLAPIGSGTTAGRAAFMMQGIYTAATSGLPTAISTNGINQTSASNMQRANIYHAIYNATY
jgi:hypothetical protein